MTTDMDTAKAIYKHCKSMGRDYCVRFMMDAGLKKVTATTYYNLLKKKDTQLTLKKRVPK